MDEQARLMNLSRWKAGLKPTKPNTPATTTASTAPASDAAATDGEAAAEGEEPPAKKQKVAQKAYMSCTGEVKGSAMHPNGEHHVIGVRTETGQDFLVAEDGLRLIPNVDGDVKSDTRVRITDAGKVYPKFDEKAYELGLSRWVLGDKPISDKPSALIGKVMGSTAK